MASTEALGGSGVVIPAAPKKCRIMTFLAVFRGLGLSVYLLWGFRYLELNPQHLGSEYRSSTNSPTSKGPSTKYCYATGRGK